MRRRLLVTISLYAATATSSNLTDQGADANEIVGITDQIGAMTLPIGESFGTLEGPVYGTVYRGVSETPVPEPATLSLLGGGVLALVGLRRRRRA